ncbi:MAG: HepT-like ribonuclease domain-containing protein [Sulfurimonas sp.]
MNRAFYDKNFYIRFFRNLLIHEYFGVDSQIVWNTIQNDLPLLKVVVQEMIANN